MLRSWMHLGYTSTRHKTFHKLHKGSPELRCTPPHTRGCRTTARRMPVQPFSLGAQVVPRNLVSEIYDIVRIVWCMWPHHSAHCGSEGLPRTTAHKKSTLRFCYNCPARGALPSWLRGDRIVAVGVVGSRVALEDHSRFPQPSPRNAKFICGTPRMHF